MCANLHTMQLLQCCMELAKQSSIVSHGTSKHRVGQLMRRHFLQSKHCFCTRDNAKRMEKDDLIPTVHPGFDYPERHRVDVMLAL